MHGIVDMDKFRKSILDSMDHLIKLRAAAEAYSVTPTDDLGEVMVQAFNKFASSSETLDLGLQVLVKQAHGIDDEIVVAQTENGILLR